MNFSTTFLLIEMHLYKTDFWRIMRDWSNDAENSALYYRNKLHFKIQIN